MDSNLKYKDMNLEAAIENNRYTLEQVIFLENTKEEIESITRENPDRFFCGDRVVAKNGDYLIYAGNNKWLTMYEIYDK